MKKPLISKRIGRLTLDRRLLGLLILLALALGGWAWLIENPQHNPWAPLDLRDPVGWATATKLAGLRDDPMTCRAVLERSEVAFEALTPTGEGACARPDRTRLTEFPLSPRRDPSTCQLAAGMQLWLDRAVQPAAEEFLGSKVERIEQLGIYSCRRLYGGSDGPWSEHATGNAIDVAGFVLADGKRVSVLSDWEGDDAQAQFLRAVRDGACDYFATTLSPDYNAAHRDHFHLDQADRAFGSACR